MNIELSDDLKQYVRQKLASGAFASEGELVAEALRVLRNVEQAIPRAEDDLRREIDVGLRDVEEGRTAEWSVHAMKEMVRRTVQGKKAS
jgi:putative addiction module CopG family antidote